MHVFRIVISLVVILALGCRELISQNPSDNFVSGKNPRALQVLADQQFEISQEIREDIIRRHEADKKIHINLELLLLILE